MDGELKKEIKDTFFTNSDFIYIYIFNVPFSNCRREAF